MEFIKGIYGPLSKGGLFGAGLMCTLLWKKRYFPENMALIYVGMTSAGFGTLIYHLLEEYFIKEKMSCKRAVEKFDQTMESKAKKSPEEINMDALTRTEERHPTTKNQEQSEETSQIASASPAESDEKLVSSSVSNISGGLKTCADKFGLVSNPNRLPETSPLRHEFDPSPNTESDKLAEPAETTHAELFKKMGCKVKKQMSRQQELADETVIEERRPTTQNEKIGEVTSLGSEDGEERFVSPKIIATCTEHLKVCAEEFRPNAVPGHVRVSSSCSEYDAKELEADEMELEPPANVGIGNEESKNKMAKPVEITCEETEVGGQSSAESSDSDDEVFHPNYVFKGTHRVNLDKKLCHFFG